MRQLICQCTVRACALWYTARSDAPKLRRRHALGRYLNGNLSAGGQLKSRRHEVMWIVNPVWPYSFTTVDRTGLQLVSCKNLIALTKIENDGRLGWLEPQCDRDLWRLASRRWLSTDDTGAVNRRPTACTNTSRIRSGDAVQFVAQISGTFDYFIHTCTRQKTQVLSLHTVSLIHWLYRYWTVHRPQAMCIDIPHV